MKEWLYASVIGGVIGMVLVLLVIFMHEFKIRKNPLKHLPNLKHHKLFVQMYKQIAPMYRKDKQFYQALVKTDEMLGNAWDLKQPNKQSDADYIMFLLRHPHIQSPAHVTILQMLQDLCT